MSEVALQYHDPWRYVKIAAWVALAIVMLIFLPSVLIGVAIFFLGRNFFTRTQWLTLGVIALLITIVTLPKTLGLYFMWVMSLFKLESAVTFIFNVTLTTPLWIPPYSVLIIGILSGSIIGALLGADGNISTITPSAKPKMTSSLVPTNHDEIRDKIIKKMPVPRNLIPSAENLANNYKGPKQSPGNLLIPIGRDKERKPVYISEKELQTHGVILGATGSGKTETIKWFTGALMDIKYSLLIIDMKEDLDQGGLRDFCRAYAYVNDLPYQEIALSDDNGYWYLNALAGMNADQAFDAVVSQAEFDDQFHQAMNKKASGQVNKLLFEAYETWPDRYPAPSLKLLGTTLQNMYTETKPMLVDVQQAKGKDYVMQHYSALMRKDQDLEKEAMTFGLRLTNLYDTLAGEMALSPGVSKNGAQRVALDVTAPGVIYIGASSTGFPELAKTVSASVMSRMNAMAADIAAGKFNKDELFRRALVIDEANMITRSHVHNALSRYRSAKISLFLATQGPTDWIDEHGDDWGRLTQNINVCIAGKMSSPEAAKLTAEYIGTDKFIGLNRRVTDGIVEESGSIKEQEDYLVPPQDFRGLDSGEMVMRTPKQQVWMQVPMRNWEVDKYLADGAPPLTPERNIELLKKYQ